MHKEDFYMYLMLLMRIKAISKKYNNQNLLITGNKITKLTTVMKIVKRLFKIKNKIKFLNKKGIGHYDKSPYSYVPRKKKFLIKPKKNIISELLNLKMKSIKDNFKLLDCTLRDGGYYNNWNFSEKIIRKCPKSIETTGIEYVEIGFRFYEEKKIKGLTAYTENKLIKKLKVSKNIHLGVMINTSDLIIKNKFQPSILKKLINKNKISKIKFVRLACHHHEVFFLKKFYSYLKKLNLDIFVNIMQISEIDLNLLKEFL